MVPGKGGAEAKSYGHPTPSFSLSADPSGSGPRSWVMHPTHCGEETPRWPAETPIQRWTVTGDAERGRLKGQERGEGWQGAGEAAAGRWRRRPRWQRGSWEVELHTEAAAPTAESHLEETRGQVQQRVACQNWGPRVPSEHACSI